MGSCVCLGENASQQLHSYWLLRGVRVPSWSHYQVMMMTHCETHREACRTCTQLTVLSISWPDLLVHDSTEVSGSALHEKEAMPSAIIPSYYYLGGPTTVILRLMCSSLLPVNLKARPCNELCHEQELLPMHTGELPGQETDRAAAGGSTDGDHDVRGQTCAFSVA